MSELTKLVKRKDELFSWFNSATTSSTGTHCDIEETGTLKKYLDEVNVSLLPKALKLLNKTGEVDPVASTPRYGSAAILKITTLHEHLTSIQSSMQSLLDDAIAKGIPEKKVDDENKLTAKLRKVEPSADAIYTDQTGNVWTAALGYQDSSRLHREEKTTLQKADEIKNNVLLDPLAPIKAELKKCLQTFNGAKSGCDIFLEIINKLRQPNTGTDDEDANKRSLQSMLNFLSSLLQNICSHPDDEKLRLLRLQHPVVYEKLVRGYCSLDLLCAAGFTIRCDVPPAKDKDEDESAIMAALSFGTAVKTGGGSASSSSNRTEIDHVLGVHAEAGALPKDPRVSRLLQLANELGLTTVAFLREPSVEDTSQWVVWFDMLTAVKKACIVEAAVR